MKLKYLTQENDTNKLIKDVIKPNLHISNVLFNKLKLTNSILVNGEVVFANYILKENDLVTIDFDNMNYIIHNDVNHMYYTVPFLQKYDGYDLPLDIIYEDEYILVVNKPYNMPVHPSCNNYTHTLSNAVATYLKDDNVYNIHIVTRLDKDTSGICIFAKNEYVQELFFRLKNKVKFEKEYFAVIYGIVLNEHDIIEKPIARKQGTIILREVNEVGDFAKTEYFVITRDYIKNCTHLKIILHTGRTHQIRVHMSHISHPLLGDDLYSDNLDILKYLKRQALHAKKVSFVHPITNETIILESSISEDILNI